MTQFDFVIAGYGPVGATMANLLGRAGFTVAIADRYADIYDKPRAITVDHEIMRCWQACGLGDEIAKGTGIHKGTDYVGVDNEIIKIFNPLPPPYPLGWAPAITFVQPELEAILRNGIKRFGNVTEYPGFDVRIAGQDASGIAASLTPVEGQARGEAPAEVRCKYLLGCDGANSSIRNACGITIEDLGFNEWWIVIDAHARDMSVLPERSHQYCWPSRPGTHIIGPGNLRRWEIKLLPGETPETFKTDASLREVLRLFADPDVLDIWRYAIYQFHAVVADDWRKGNVFLMGDAAHRMPPFLGQGLCAGIRDAYNFAWKLEQVERHGASPALLDSYRSERRPHVKTVVANAKAFGLIIGELDEAKARERDRRLRAELESGAAETIRSKFIPDLAGGIVAREGHGTGAPLAKSAGSLFVQPRVLDANGDEKRLDDVTGYRFLLIGDEATITTLAPETLAILEKLGGLAVAINAAGKPAAAADASRMTLSETDGLFAGWRQETGFAAALVRPDRYVYGGARDAREAAQLAASLSDVMFAPS
ncbi:MAG: bifunctional 3-(3-hydroxy-phenyl)propionate/3-hydroxycinnamic acid hydroxylase [Hyphomicrobiales bacterium]|nr:bifunctional 3-(3-hydroxy-phenyl)propionate/3-hydroxycinnamic acid hydroxylase [Hyphomicrobiales bacterium]